VQTYHVKLTSPISNSFRAVRAANSVDLNTQEKAIHELSIRTDLKTYSIGLILGASGSGKTTLAKKIFGDDIFDFKWDESKCILDLLPEALTYDECAEMLNGIGLTAIPCWIKPIYTLSNGQKARAEAVYKMAISDKIVLDEWTSVVDRNVAKVMSHCVQKFARRRNKTITLLSCHYDVVEWLDPDWIIDCNSSRFVDRRLLSEGERKRKEQIKFEVREVSNTAWQIFSKYHYLSKNLSGGKNWFFGLFIDNAIVGFCAFSNYIPTRPGNVPIYHSNRVVVHPDYVGFGLGLKLVNIGCEELRRIFHGRVDLRATFSSEAMYRLRMKDKKWKLVDAKRKIGKHPPPGKTMDRKTGFRENVKLFTFLYVGDLSQFPQVCGPCDNPAQSDL
jgi:ABC-type lipoprotein export system ATPase subunit/GNAT superfamily N-acetyltransferase